MSLPLQSGAGEVQADEMEVKIRGLMMDPVTNMPMVVLKDIGSDALVPIWVGIFEANAIALEIEKTTTPRPMTHDLLANLIRTLDGEVRRVVITELQRRRILCVDLDGAGRGTDQPGCSPVGCAGARVAYGLPHLPLCSGAADHPHGQRRRGEFFHGRTAALAGKSQRRRPRPLQDVVPGRAPL